MSDLVYLREANVARQVEWEADKLDSPALAALFYGNELGGECGEAMNVIKKLVREQLGIRGSRATVEMLAEELADVVIMADLVAIQFDIDLREAVEAKFNATSKKYNLATQLLLPL